MPPNDLQAYYAEFNEEARLSIDLGVLELTRTKEILGRFLPPAPATVFDVGGGPGIYAAWLARQGYEVHLIDPVPGHVRRARQISCQQSHHPVASFTVGDARRIDAADASADAVLLMGPMYHLTEMTDRRTALRESHRILKNNGIVFVTAISRFASLIDGFHSGFFEDPDFIKIMIRDLSDGQHDNPTDNVAYFTRAFFHRPEELRWEIEDAGFSYVRILGVESLGCLIRDFNALSKHPEKLEMILRILRSIEEEPRIIGASPHLLAVARKDGDDS